MASTGKRGASSSARTLHQAGLCQLTGVNSATRTLIPAHACSTWPWKMTRAQQRRCESFSR